MLSAFLQIKQIIEQIQNPKVIACAFILYILSFPFVYANYKHEKWLEENYGKRKSRAKDK